MGLLDKYRKSEPRNWTLNALGTDNSFLLNDNDSGALGVATYYACIKILAEAMGKLPIKVYKDTDAGRERVKNHRIEEALNYQPNPLYNAVVLKQQAEIHRLHKGNAYIWVDYFNSKIRLWLLDPDSMEVAIDGNRLQYIYTTDKVYRFEPEEIIHLKSPFTKNGILGVPTVEYLRTLVLGQKSSEEFQKRLYDSSMTGQKLFMTFGTGVEDISETQIKRQISNIEMFSKFGSGRIVPLPPLCDIKMMDLKLSDAQFMDLKKLSSQQIASSFGVPSAFLNDLEKSSYSSQEAQMIAYLVNTLSPIVNSYEVELYIKLLIESEKKAGYFASYNTNSLLRTTAKEQMEYLSMAVKSGLMTLNEGRSKLDLKKVDSPNADKLMIENGAALLIDQIGQYVKGGETK